MFACGGLGLYFHGQEGLAAIFSLFAAILENFFENKNHFSYVNLLAHSGLVIGQILDSYHGTAVPQLEY